MDKAVREVDDDGPIATDERLLAVAERLFAAHGIDAVSLRTITIEAEANIAVVHYHFGTKVDLIRTVMSGGSTRSTKTDSLASRPRTPTVYLRHDVAEVCVEPLARLATDPRRHTYLGFLVALSNAGPELRAITGDVFRTRFGLIDRALARALPRVDAPLRRFRFTLAADMGMRALADLHRRNMGIRWPSHRQRLARRGNQRTRLRCARRWLVKWFFHARILEICTKRQLVSSDRSRSSLDGGKRRFVDTPGI